jgi:hypothetical protein
VSLFWKNRVPVYTSQQQDAMRQEKKRQTHPGLHRVPFIEDVHTEAWSLVAVRTVDPNDLGQRKRAYEMVRTKVTSSKPECSWVILS